MAPSLNSNLKVLSISDFFPLNQQIDLDVLQLKNFELKKLNLGIYLVWGAHM